MRQVLSDETLRRAAHAIAEADALFIAAGAGMGVDSGLPDFRGDKGFWRAYPPFEKLGLNFADMANPTWFERDPRLAWGFYGHRLQLYRDTEPHAGFDILRRRGRTKAGGAFVFTSNVDGQFQAAGFDDRHVIECHGSIHHLQCTRPCSDDIWSAEGTQVEFDEETFRAEPPLPHCPKCNTIARPNIFMFGDGAWLSERSHAQEQRMRRWLEQVAGKDIAVVECGAGTAIPTVRWQCERLADRFDAPLIRINPREAHGPDGTLSVATGALDALTEIDALLD